MSHSACPLCRRQVQYYRWIPNQLRRLVNSDWLCLTCYKLLEVSEALSPFSETSVEQKQTLKKLDVILRDLHRHAPPVRVRDLPPVFTQAPTSSGGRYSPSTSSGGDKAPPPNLGGEDPPDLHDQLTQAVAGPQQSPSWAHVYPQAGQTVSSSEPEVTTTTDSETPVEARQLRDGCHLIEAATGQIVYKREGGALHPILPAHPDKPWDPYATSSGPATPERAEENPWDNFSGAEDDLGEDVLLTGDPVVDTVTSPVHSTAPFRRFKLTVQSSSRGSGLLEDISEFGQGEPWLVFGDPPTREESPGYWGRRAQDLLRETVSPRDATEDAEEHAEEHSTSDHDGASGSQVV